MESSEPPRNRRWPISAVLGAGSALAAFALVLGSAIPGSVIVGRRDALRFYEPLRAFLAAELRQGRLPTWYPLDGIGTSFVGSSIGALLNPLSWTALVLSPAQSVKWQGLLLLTAAAAGMFVLCRRLAASTAGSWLAAAGYGLSGYLLSTVDTPSYQQSAAALPWVVAAAEALARGPGPGAATSLGVSLAFTLWGGDVQGGYLQVALAGAVVALRPGPPRSRQLAWYLGGLLLATALTAPLLGPLWASARESGRLHGLPLSVATAWSLHPLRLLELWVGPLYVPGQVEALGPELTRFLGNAPRGDRSLEGLWSASEHLGAVPLALALVAVFTGARGRTTAIYAGCAALALLLALGRSGGLYTVAWRLVPSFGAFRYPEKLMPFALLGLSVLASLGAGELVPRRRVFAVLLGAAAFAAALAVAGGPTALAWLLGARAGSADAASTEALGGMGLALQARAAVAAAILIALVLVLRGRPGAAAWAAVALAAAQSGWCSRGVLGLDNRAVLEVASPLRAAIGAEPDAAGGRLCSWPAAYEFPGSVELPRGQARLLGDIRAMVPDHSARFGLANVIPYGPGSSGPLASACGAQPACGSECARRLGARWTIVSRAEAPALRAREGFVSLGRTDVPRLELFEDRRARPLVSAPEIHLLPDAAAIRSALPAAPAATALMAGNGPSAQAAVRRLTFRRPRPDQIEADVDLASEGILVVAEQCSAGWRASIDGSEAALDRADLALCAVRMPAGSHRLVLRYRPPGWPWAFIPYALGLSGAVAVALSSRRRPASGGDA